MIRLIAAIDSERGLSRMGKTAWNLPRERKNFRRLIATHGGNVLVGRNTFRAMGSKAGRQVFVATRQSGWSAENAVTVTDLQQFLTGFKGDLWVAGGQAILEAALPYANELYLTHVHGDFKCDSFFPSYKDDFELAQQAKLQYENGFSYQVSIYRRRNRL